MPRSADPLWRYQPVITGTHGEPDQTLSLCEVYLDEDGKLASWAKALDCAPFGDNIAELLSDIRRMKADAKQWKPVHASELKVGLAFQKAR